MLTAHPRILVLDEPTSALDPTAAEEVLAAVTRLVHDLGITVVMAEHRLERVVQHADSVVLLEDGSARLAPPSALGDLTARAAGRAARPPGRLGSRAAVGARRPPPGRDRSASASTPWFLRHRSTVFVVDAAARTRGWARRSRAGGALRRRRRRSAASTSTVRRGEVVAVMGRNGSGKSSLLWALHPAGRRQAGTVHGRRRRSRRRAAVAGRPGAADAGRPPLPRHGRRGVRAGRPGDRAPTRAPAGRSPIASCPGCRATTTRATCPRASGSAWCWRCSSPASPSVLLLDEPTRGLDHLVKEQLTRLLRELAADGRVVVVATHDVEFVAGAADRVVVLADGEIVADGPTADVVVASPAFAPQVAKVLHPDRWLTVDEVAAALAGAPA